MSIRIHRREQWDLFGRPSVIPWICVHQTQGDITRRLFVLCRFGVRIALPGRRVYERAFT